MRWPGLLAALFCFTSLGPADAGPTPVTPRIAIIIDDLGYSLAEGRRVIALAGPVACALLPHTPHARELAELAHRKSKDILLHAPMQAMEPGDPGPGVLLLDMTQAEFLRALREDLAAVPYAIGLNNHMGSLLTRHPGHMAWLMGELRTRENFFFVDSMTTIASVAARLASEHAVPHARRDVFLDHNRNPAKIDSELRRLIELARSQGQAVAIGHPHPETLRALERLLPRLGKLGVNLVPISQLVHPQEVPDAHRTRTARARM